MKLGILGGTFNPLHTGHVRMAIEVREALGLDMVELVPASIPPHKKSEGILPFEMRMEMVRRAVRDIPGLNGNSLEGERSGPSFTCDTLTCYREEQPQSELHFIMGAATFLELPNWNRGLEVPGLANLVVVNRWEASDRAASFIAETWPDAVEESEGLWRMPEGNTVRMMEIPRLDIKAGDLRERWKAGRSLHLLVPAEVEAFLDENRAAVLSDWGA